MIDKASWQRLWGFVPGSPDGEAAWAEKSRPSRFSAPALMRSSIDPCLGPDGRMHDNLASYRKSLRADGNPQGENYIELGTESLKPVEQSFDRKERREHIRAGLEDVKNGRVPPLTVLED